MSGAARAPESADAFYLPVTTECGTCDAPTHCQWDGADGDWFCLPCWQSAGMAPPNPAWPVPSVVCTRDQNFAAVYLQQWRARVDAPGAASVGAMLVGFDVEWRPNFVKGSAPNRVALLQLSETAGLNVLTRLVGQKSLHPEIVALLTHPRVVLVGVGVKEDVWKLIRDYPQLAAPALGGRVADLGEVARKLGHVGGFSLKKLAEHHDVPIAHKSKKLAMTNWEKTTLGPLEITYGAQDAKLGLTIGEAMARRFAPDAKSAAEFLAPFVQVVAGGR